MEEKDLENFRGEWLQELTTTKQNHSQLININEEEEEEEEEEGRPTTTSSKRHKTSDNNTKKKQLPAFDIANTYLNLNSTSSECRYCNIQKHNSKFDSATRETCMCYSHTDRSVAHRKLKQSLLPGGKRKSRKVGTKLYFGAFLEHFGAPLNESGCSKDTEENLVDLLIADIDEITCIPFFDIELPREIAIEIFQYLSIQDLSSCSLVNSKWRVLASDDLIWFNLCHVLDVDRAGKCVADIHGWNGYVKGFIVEWRRVQSKWKGRCCEVTDLGSSEDVVCTASLHATHLVAAYLDGSIKIWNLTAGCCGDDLKEKYSNIEDIVLSICSSIHLSKYTCVAGFENGDIMVWQRSSGELSGQLVYVENFDSKCILSVQSSNDGRYIAATFDCKFVLIATSEVSSDQWTFKKKIEREMHEKICTLMLLNRLSSPGISVVTSTSSQLTLHLCQSSDENVVTIDQVAGATISAVDIKESFLVAGISAFGYSIFDGYMIRKYCLKSGKQTGNIIGSQTVITCLNYADCYNDLVVVGCADCSIRIHDFKRETSLVSICGIDSTITTIQMDKWKVVTGHQNGNVCLWDCVKGTMHWQSRPCKHPVHIATFDDHLLTSVNITVDKFNTHQRSYGKMRVMDFTKATDVFGIPEEFHADYDDITGYDYNIELIAPYDDVQTLHLPQI